MTEREAEQYWTDNGYAVMRINTIKARTTHGAVVTSYICYPTIKLPDGRSITLREGCADLLVMRGNNYFFFEAKRMRDKLNPNQTNFKIWCTRFGIPYFVGYDVNQCEEIKTIIEGATL